MQTILPNIGATNPPLAALRQLQTEVHSLKVRKKAVGTRHLVPGKAKQQANPVASGPGQAKKPQGQMPSGKIHT